ncbi:ydiF [Symbiodinium microadriaticum]|nr:ydiF [Symbiodinium microadriaticum]
MAAGSFRACWIEKVGASLQMELKQVPFDELSAGAEYIRVKVDYSGVNYKDGMAICGIYGVVEKLPLITGIDFVGTVDETRAGFKKGDRVIMTGYEMGQKFHGGHAEYASVKAEWLVPLPETLAPIDAMTIGTAGFTAALCIKALEDSGFDKTKPILVTGADGGVGSVAVYLLAQKGCQVAACTRWKDTEARLRKLGASEIVPALSTDSKALDEQKWGGAIDVVGGPTIPTICSQMAYGCTLATCGVAGGPAIKTTVYPFIIRGVKLYGVDSVFASTEDRKLVWSDLAKVPSEVWRDMRKEVAMDDLQEVATQILAGKIRGRVVVNMGLKGPQLAKAKAEEEDLEALKQQCIALRKSLTASSKVVSADQAMSTIVDGDCVTLAGFVATMPCDALSAALRKRFDKTKHPRDLEMVFSIIVGDREGKGTDQLTPLARKATFGWTDVCPAFTNAVLSGKIQGYNLPMGQISHMIRSSANRVPGHLSKVGLGTFADPRNGGGKRNKQTTEDLVKIVEMGSEEYIFYPAPKITVALLRGSIADEAGNVSFEREPLFLDSLNQAMAAKNNGGLVVVQVQQVVPHGSLDARRVHIPGMLVDMVVVAGGEHAAVTYAPADQTYDATLSGELKPRAAAIEELPWEGPRNACQKRVMAHRAMFEVKCERAVLNFGVGSPEFVAAMIETHGQQNPYLKGYMPTVESGVWGGQAQGGFRFGTSVGFEAIMPTSSMMDFYVGGGIDVAFLGVGEVDEQGNVNVSNFAGRVPGVGGFADIAANAKTLVFTTTLTCGNLVTKVEGGKLVIVQEGSIMKFKPTIDEITFPSASQGSRRIIFVTERCVMELRQQRLVLTELASGISLDNVLSNMGFRPEIAECLGTYDPRIFER